MNNSLDAEHQSQKIIFQEKKIIDQSKEIENQRKMIEKLLSKDQKKS